MSKSAIIVGSGIVGLATARALAIRGYKVTVIDKTQIPLGASIRNFGMIWPIGQPTGTLYERALLSKSIWKEVCDATKCWYTDSGSLHIASHTLEEDVINEFYESEKGNRSLTILTRSKVEKTYPSVRASGIHSVLYSLDEMVVNPLAAILKLKKYLEEQLSVRFEYGCVTDIDYPKVQLNGRFLKADEIFVCSGADIETLYPDVFQSLPLIKCKLQMMRLEAQPESWELGSSLCGGLSLIHYKSFEIAPSHNALKEHFMQTIPEYIKWGIHVMASTNEKGQLTIGDSHEYGNNPLPFDKASINNLVLEYLKEFTNFPSYKVEESWNGVYAKMMDGRTELVLEPENGVTIINGLGGAGMTLSFGLCEQIVAKSHKTSLSL